MNLRGCKQLFLEREKMLQLNYGLINTFDSLGDL